MKVLNLYAGIGGNRKLWQDVDVTAVELNKSIAAIYGDFFPDDNIIIGDAHQYLLDHYSEFDFIWSSPPCPTHSKMRLLNVGRGINGLEYPDMKLYQEIVILRHHFKGKYVVENVVPYYEPLIKGQEIDRHLFWANFYILPFNDSDSFKMKGSIVPELQKRLGFNISKYKLSTRRDQVLRNCVNPELGKHILDCAMERMDLNEYEQQSLFLK